MLDENQDLFVPLPDDHPVALGIPLPHSLLAPHTQFGNAVRAAIATIESKRPSEQPSIAILRMKKQ